VDVDAVAGQRPGGGRCIRSGDAIPIGQQVSDAVTAEQSA
jgi:hypothetical protein